MEENTVLQELYEIISERKDNLVEGSYTSYLFKQGIDKILKKVGEEASEVIIAAKNNNENDLICEISDLIYHLIVLMVNKGIEIGDIEAELSKRRKTILNKKPEKSISGIH
jgi:phosphoribosyl-ATP pyrophosphohydrolase